MKQFEKQKEEFNRILHASAELKNSTRPLVFTSASGCRARENVDISSENYPPIYAKIVNEYDQEIPQSNCRQPRGTTRKSCSTITRHQEDKLSKAISSLFPIKMIAILEWT